MVHFRHTALDWEDIKTFAALARHGNLTATARALSVTHGTISRRISSLESCLGTRLVERRPDGYVLTHAGHAALASASEMEAAAQNLARDALGEGPKGIVRVSATPGLTFGFLLPRLAMLAAQHATLDIEVTADLRQISLERREADIALRFGRPTDGDVLATPLLTIDYSVFGTRHWHDVIKSGASPVFVGFDEANYDIPDAAWLSKSFPSARVALRANNQMAHAQAARVGAGVALLPYFIARDGEPLVECPLEFVPPSRELWLVTRRADAKSAPIVATSEFLKALFNRERALFSR